MRALVRALRTRSGIAAAAGLFTFSVGVIAQQPATPQAPAAPPAAPPAAGPPPNPNAAANAADHQNMMEQLGIKACVRGRAATSRRRTTPTTTRRSANPYPESPRRLTLKNGKKVTTADMWWKQRRPEIVEDFEREVLGRVPKNVPKVTWTREPHRDVTGRRASGHRQAAGRRTSTTPRIRTSPSTSR